MSENTRYGLYFAMSALGFLALLVPALLSFWHGASRARLSIIAFIVSWAVFCGMSAANRLGSPMGAPLPVGVWAEVIRVAGFLSVWGVVVEFIVLRSRTPWDGSERRNGKERRRDWCRS